MSVFARCGRARVSWRFIYIKKKGKGEETPRETKRDTETVMETVETETAVTTAAHASQLIINHIYYMLNATEMRAPAVAGSSS